MYAVPYIESGNSRNGDVNEVIHIWSDTDQAQGYERGKPHQDRALPQPHDLWTQTGPAQVVRDDATVPESFLTRTLRMERMERNTVDDCF